MDRLAPRPSGAPASSDSKTRAPQTDHPTKVFVSAIFGGAATPLLELTADARVEGWSQLSLDEFVVVLVLALVGGGFVWTQKETDMKKAFFLGVTAPALILGAGDATDALPSAHQGAGLIPHVVLVQPLHAAEPPSTSETRSISIETDAAVTGDFYIRGNWGAETKLQRYDGDHSWVLPTGEVTLLFRGRLDGRIPVETPWTEIPRGTQPITVQLHVEDPQQTLWGNILDGLAMDNRAREYVRSAAKIEIPQ